MYQFRNKYCIYANNLMREIAPWLYLNTSKVVICVFLFVPSEEKHIYIL